jgi:MoaA/NifB/PqqE/SkfB family radical SAM enzyme
MTATEARTAPKGILILSLTSACGCNCVFCGLPDSRPHTVLSPASLVTALEGAPNGRWQEVNITGGDPLVMPAAHRLFPELLARMDRFARLSVSTAGVPAKAALAGLAALAEVPSLDVYVSLDGVGGLHDRVRRREGAFAEVSAFLEAARRRDGITIALTCVINSLNVDGLDELADYAQERGFPVSYAVVNSSDHYIRSLPLYDATRLTADQVERALGFLSRRSKQRLNEDLRRVMRGGRRELPCRLLHDGVLVTSDGAVSICGTSQRMLLATEPQVTDSAWRSALGRRQNLLASGVSDVCGTCTSNCYAWRTTDVPAP